jgi:hypothetical protein
MVATIHGPLHSGTREIEALADAITAAYRGVTDTGVTFATPSIYPVGRMEKDWQAVVSCPWEAEHLA